MNDIKSLIHQLHVQSHFTVIVSEVLSQQCGIQWHLQAYNDDQ